MTFVFIVLLGSGKLVYAQEKIEIAQLQYNSIEELNEHYENGYRIISVYLEKDLDGEIILENGIELEKLVYWMEKHPDTQILFRTRGLDLEILQEAHKRYPEIKTQGIVEIKDPENYRKISFNGFRNIVLNAKFKDHTDTEIRQMAYTYPYFGFIVDKDKLSPNLLEGIKGGRTFLYLEETDPGNLSSHIMDKMADGYIVNPQDDKIAPIEPNIENPYIVAHAGGQIGSHTYTNSIEAMENSYKNGIRLMEMDFEWSTDGQLVGIHSWDGFITKFFNAQAKRHSYLEYENFKMINGWQHSTLEKLDNWYKEHPDGYLITDIKGDNIQGLRILKHRYPELAERTIPQIYKMEEYQKVKDLGYQDIILTLYLMENTDDEIINFASENKLFAVTMPELRAETTLPQRLKDIGVYVYAHTVNSLKQADKLEKLGVSGFYSDMIWNDNLTIFP